MRRPVGLPALVLSTLALVCCWPVVAKEEAQPEVAAGKEPAVIASAEIPIRADADERFVQDVIERSKGRDRTAGLVKSLDQLTAGIAESQSFKRDELNLLSIMRLESLERHWKFYQKQLKDWRRELRQASGQFSEDAAELANRRAMWEATSTAAGTAAWRLRWPIESAACSPKSTPRKKPYPSRSAGRSVSPSGPPCSRAA